MNYGQLQSHFQDLLNTGANGNASNGSGGSSGGAAGAAVAGTSITINNSGSVYGVAA